MISKIIAIVLLILISPVAAFAQAIGPAETIKAFYKYSDAHSSTFNRRHLESRKGWYTPALYQAFLAHLRDEQAYLKKNPTNKPFFGDGLDFKPLNESCNESGRTYRRMQSISRRTIWKMRAYIDVRFAYPAPCKVAPVDYRVKLEKIHGKWLISDWIYSSSVTLTQEMRENRHFLIR
jgi:hypothetical protein